MKAVLFLAASLALLAPCTGGFGAPKTAYSPQEGDLYFQSSPHNPLVDAIEGATDSPYSHCGILHKASSGWVVIEAIQPVCETPLEDWIARGRSGRHAVHRFRPEYRPHIPEIITAAKTYKGRPYDSRYRMDDERIYCSELLYKAFRSVTREELGCTQRLGELNWKPFVETIRALENGGVPLERRMITPRAISEASQVELVRDFDS